MVKNGKNSAARAEQILKMMTQNWTILDHVAESNVPRFQLNEFTLGRVLGRGGYCVVKEITGVHLKADEKKPINDARRDSNTSIHSLDDPAYPEFTSYSSGTVVQDRNFISARFKRNGEARYAIKMISESTMRDDSRFERALIDLAVEVKMLAVIKHVNIIKMRAVYEGNHFSKENFIVLDRLYDTLSHRIVKWKKEKGSLKAKFKSSVKKKIFETCFLVARDLCSAFVYLHEHNIIYRDLKPDNIGFDVRDDVKLFDFGLAKELPQGDDENAVYKLSAETGTRRYMAPEVGLGKPYNLKADVYSFGILMWQILTLAVPFSGYTIGMFNKAVFDKGARPKLQPEWSEHISGLMSSSWTSKINDRPSFEELFQRILKANEDDIYSLDQSTHSNRTAVSLENERSSK